MNQAPGAASLFFWKDFLQVVSEQSWRLDYTAISTAEHKQQIKQLQNTSIFSIWTRKRDCDIAFYN